MHINELKYLGKTGNKENKQHKIACRYGERKILFAYLKI